MTLEDLAEGEHAAIEIEPTAVAQLGYAAGLDREAFLVLVDRDITARTAADQELGVTGYTDEELQDLRSGLAEVWAAQELPETGDEGDAAS
jgi:hypothetical protein